LKQNKDVLYEYKCVNLLQDWIVIIGSIFIISLSIMKLLEKSTSSIQTLGFLVIILSFLLVVYRSVHNLSNQGFYVTSEKLITFSGKKISLKKIEYKFVTAPQFFSSKILFYNEGKYLLSCSVNEDNEEFKKFLDVLSEVTANAQFKTSYQKSYFKKTKLA
jgi:hypothetical protein